MPLSQSIEQSHKAMVEGRDVPWLLNLWVERTPDNPFLIWAPFEGEDRRWSYAEFGRDVKAVAAALHNRGIAPGERVLLHLDNSPEFMISWFACAHIGAVAVSTNTRSVARDMSYFSDHAGVVAAITQPGFAEMVQDCAPEIRFLVVTDNNAGEVAEVAPAVEYTAFAQLLVEQGECPVRAPDPFANLGIQFTSGATSRPKAVLWTHANTIWGAQMNASHMRLSGDDITLAFLPLFHTNAQS